MSKYKHNIETGMRLGRLFIGDLVRHVQEHPLYLETPVSYLQQGRLRECICDCSNMRLIAEAILATGRVKSCGCLRQEIRAKASQKKVGRLEVKAAKANLLHRIKIEQAKLQALKMQPVYTRDEEAILECAARIRQLFSQQGILTRKLRGELGGDQ